MLGINRPVLFFSRGNALKTVRNVLRFGVRSRSSSVDRSENEEEGMGGGGGGGGVGEDDERRRLLGSSEDTAGGGGERHVGVDMHGRWVRRGWK